MYTYKYEEIGGNKYASILKQGMYFVTLMATRSEAEHIVAALNMYDSVMKVARQDIYFNDELIDAIKPHIPRGEEP